MTKLWLLLAVVSLLAVAAVACGPSQAERDLPVVKQQLDEAKAQIQTLKALAGEPPAGLDNLFPPKAPAPLLLLQMLAMVSPMEAVIVDLMEQDMANVQANYAKFKEQYQKTAKMVSDAVPEWKDKFPTAPVDALGAALQSGDPAKLQQAMGDLGKVCDDCHGANLVKVQQKYHWPDFSKVTVTDPISKQTLPWRQFMEFVSGSFSGIGINLQEGQLDNARKNFQAFNAQFAALRQGCSNCHATPRTYFVDSSVQDLVDKLGVELQAASPNPQTIGQLSQGIGSESCGKCHWVHFPAAKARGTWQLAK